MELPGRRELRLMSVMQMCIERLIRLFCVQDIVDMEHFRRRKS